MTRFAFAQDDELWSLQADQWKIKTRQGQASQLVGDLLFRSSGQSLLSREAWLWRSSDGGLDVVSPGTCNMAAFFMESRCVTFIKQIAMKSWLVIMLLFSMVCVISLCMVLQRKSELMVVMELVLKSVNATPCPLDDPAWSVSADQLDWSVKSKQARLQNVRFYWYDYPVFYVKDWRMSVGGRNPYGWQSPRIASYYQDPLLLSYPIASYQIVYRLPRHGWVQVVVSVLHFMSLIREKVTIIGICCDLVWQAFTSFSLWWCFSRST